MILQARPSPSRRRSPLPRIRGWRQALAIVPALLVLGWLGLAAQQPAPQPPTGQQAPPAPPTSPPGQTAPTPPQGQGQQGQSPQGQAPQGQDAPQPPQPIFRTGINFIKVDVLVSDKKGEPVLDLKQTDFEVTEDDKPQAIEAFRLIKVTGRPVDGETPREIRSDYVLESEAARDDVRIFAVMLDDYHVRRGASMAVREPLTRFVRNSIGPMDLVGIAYPLTPFKDISFTRNHEGLIRAFERFDGRKYDYQPRNELEERYMYYPVEVVERVRNQVSLSAIRSVCAGLGTLREGRKSLILVSEGYSNYVPPQLRDPSAAYPGLNNPNRRNPMAGENNMNEDRSRFFNSVDLLQEMRDVFNECNRANVAIYAVDPRGLAAFEFDINEGVGQGVDRASLGETLDSLRTLAGETDGRAIVNRNDLDVGMKQIMRDSSAYYLIGYNSSQAPQDGKFHKIDVKVKRSGVSVRARKGYWALTAAETARALSPPKPGPDPALGRALAAIEAPNRARVVRTWIGTTRGENGKTAVTLVWEPASRAPGDRREPPANVAVMAQGAGGAFFRGKAVAGATTGGAAGSTASAGGTGAAGAGSASPGSTNAASSGGASNGTTGGGTAGTGSATAANSTWGSSRSSNGTANPASGTGTAAIAGPTGSPTVAAAAGGRGGRVTFVVPPGPLQMRLSVEGAAGQVLDSDFRDIVVPDYTATEAALSEPAVYRARTQRDLTTLATDPQAMPTTAREFSRTERLLIRVAAYSPGGSATTPTFQLLNRDGQKMSDLVVKPLTAAGEGVYQAELPLAGLPAGEFLVQISIGEGGSKQLVGLRVTS